MDNLYWYFAKGKSLLDYANLLSFKDYEKNDKIILKYFQKLKRWKVYISLFAGIIEKLKNLKYHIFYKKNLFLLLLPVKARNFYLKKLSC